MQDPDRLPPAMPEYLKNASIFLVSCLLCYLLAEAGYSYLYRHGLLDNGLRDGWFFKEADQTIHFDPVIGYRLGAHPSTNIRIVEGKVEYTGTFQGNNQGFQDSHDFFPARPADNPFRVAILGDSFATEQFHERNWPDTVESWASQQPAGRRLEILNFSLNGGGLVNWRNILLERIEREGYELDLLVIPVFADNLFRQFVVYEARNTRKLLIGRTGYDPDHLPQTFAEVAACCVYESDGYILNGEEWRKFVEEGWHPTLPLPEGRYLKDALLFISALALQSAREALATGTVTPVLPAANEDDTFLPDPRLGHGQLGPAQLRLINDIKGYIQRQRIPVIIVRVPERNELAHQAPVAGNVLDFAGLLGAPVVDGLAAFAGVAPEERQQQYFPHDGHWNQQGSDNFARFMLAVLREQQEASQKSQ